MYTVSCIKLHMSALSISEVRPNLLSYFSLVTQFEFEKQLHTLSNTANTLTLYSAGSPRTVDCTNPISLLHSEAQTNSTLVFYIQLITR